MVEIAAPVGWVTSSIPEPALARAAASVAPIPFANESATNAVIGASAASTKSASVLAHLVHSPAILWSASGIALLSLAGLGAAFALHGSSKSTVREAQVVAADANAASAATSVERQPDNTVCTGLAAAMDAQSQIEFPTDESPAKSLELVDHTTQQSKIDSPQSPDSGTDLATESNRPTDDSAVRSLKSTSAAPRTLKLEPIAADATAAEFSPIVQLAKATKPQYPPVSNSRASSDAEIHGEDGAELRAETASSQAAVNSRRLMRFGPTTQDAAHRTNIADQVAVPIKSFDVSGVPLKRVLDTLANMAAVPIAVDPAALSAADVSLDTQVTVHAHDLTLGKLLGGVLREHNLACEVRDGQLVIVARAGEASASAP